MSTTYRAFGLTIASEFEMPEFWVAAEAAGAAGDADIFIVVGRIGDGLNIGQRCEDGFDVGPRHILLEVPGVGRFLAEDGRRLTVEPVRGADPRNIRLYLKGSALAAIFHQRGLFPLHSAAVEYAGGCVAFLGSSGAGKSTLAGMLAQRGFRLLSDDVILVQPGEGGALIAEASLPALKLWPESLAPTGMSDRNSPYEAADYRKHHILSPISFTRSALPLRRLYFLRWLLPASAAPQIARVSPFDAMLALRPNVFRPSLIDALGREAGYLAFAARLMAVADAFKFDRGCHLAGAQEQIDVLEQHIRGG